MVPALTVSVPYWRCQGTIRRCVESILSQTHRDLLCVVVNDADTETPPWPVLVDIDDPRLVRFDLPSNRGCYFIDAVTTLAADTVWWSRHDADDWSPPHRIATLLTAAKPDTEVVLGAHTNHHTGGSTRVRRIKPLRPGRMRYTVHPSGLWRTAVAASLTAPAWRIEWAALMTSAALLAGHTEMVQEPLYQRVIRPGSLVTDPATGHRSAYRYQCRREMKRIWRAIEAAQPRDLAAVAAVLRRELPHDLRAEVTHHADRLRTLLREIR